MIEPEPGDLLLVKTDHFVSKLIRFGQRGYGKDAAQWNHVAIYVGDGKIVEALTKGVQENDATKYAGVCPTKIVVANPKAGDSDKMTLETDVAMTANAVAFARSCVGETYGYVTILAVMLKVLTKGKLGFNIQGTSICSGLAARSWERLGYNFQPYDPAELTPAFLAQKEERL